MCMCVTLSAMVTLIFLFMPKLYIIIFQPERNNRALFTTSKSIRCHIGSRVASAISDKSSSSFNNTNRGIDSLGVAIKKQDKSTTTPRHNVSWSDGNMESIKNG